ncbi:MAG: F0F1 ATP synthase subunit A [Alphaproteobacteria bacterium]|nr:F0F1 ATP synthase subunit A [Alphaproteobacteria bacterium]
MTLPFPGFLPTVSTDPIHQFKIFSLLDWNVGAYNLSFTNSSFWMLVSTGLVLTFLGLAASRGGLIPNRLQSLGELSYGFIADMVRSTAGEEGLKFFPFVFTLFFFILGANIVGMFPYAFTTTSHIAVTGALAIVVILIVVGYGIYKNGLGFFGLFAPHGVPLPVMFFLVPIEIISFLARPITLGMRLFANMLAGHIMLKLLAIFVVMLAGAGLAWAAWVPYVLLIPITSHFTPALFSSLTAFCPACPSLTSQATARQF